MTEYNPNVKVILLTGPAGAGKSTVKELIQDNSPDQHYVSMKFASYLKTMLGFGFDLTVEHTEGHLKQVPCPQLGGRTPRHAMQTLGTEWGRKCIHEDIWPMRAVADVREHYVLDPTTYTGFIFDDARFPNEIDLMREAFDTRVINIVPEFEGYTPIETSGHESEQHVLDWDVQIINKWSLEDLEKQVLEAIA